MNEQEAGDSMEPQVPESWSAYRPVPPIKSRSNVLLWIASGVGAVVLAAMVMQTVYLNRTTERKRGPTAVLPRVRWEYKTVTIEARDNKHNADGTLSVEKYTESERWANGFVFPEFQIDKLGDTGWELVSVVPNIETVFPYGKPGNTRVKELLLFFKRASEYTPRTDEEQFELDRNVERRRQK